MLRESRRKATKRTAARAARASHEAGKPKASQVLQRIVESDFIRRVSAKEYREKVRDVYGGPQGAFLAACSYLSLHVPLGERLFRERKFDLRGARRILDVGSGAGQIINHLLKHADAEATITGFDLSIEMLRRARQRAKSTRPRFISADLSCMPFADGSFDCVTCGYVLEHLPDPRQGLKELARVLVPGGRMLLLTTEDNLSGAWTSRIWCCRTYNRRELYQMCEELGLAWKRELWYTRMHKVLRAGGICVEIQRQ